MYVDMKEFLHHVYCVTSIMNYIIIGYFMGSERLTEGEIL
jgi:hypothetical protein